MTRLKTYEVRPGGPQHIQAVYLVESNVPLDGRAFTSFEQALEEARTGLMEAWLNDGFGGVEAPQPQPMQRDVLGVRQSELPEGRTIIAGYHYHGDYNAYAYVVEVAVCS